MSYQMMFQPQDEIWKYQHSQYVYQNFGKCNDSLFWNVSLTLKLNMTISNFEDDVVITKD